jgi:LL-diaminopimelate aminotransferase
MQLSNLTSDLLPYHFAGVNKKMTEREMAGVDVISLAMGDPDLPAPQTVIDRMCEALQNPVNHHYPEYRGMSVLREAFALWFERRFGIRLLSERDMIPLLGSKEGLVYAGAAILNAGDVALLPDPSYPVYISASANVGAQLYKLPLLEQNNYLPDLESIPRDILARARLLWLNYPNNPTSACADHRFFEDAVQFAHRHNLVIVHDMAYAEVYFEDARPMSILQIPGAYEVAIELHSLSKSYNMAGFRVGMLVGNQILVDAVGRLKSHIDHGMFRPIQYAATEALQLPETWTRQRNEIYAQRRDLLVAGLNAVGLRTPLPSAGLYVWSTIPRGRSSYDFVEWLFEETGIYVTPGTNFGNAGEGYVRISFTVPDECLEEAVRRIQAALIHRMDNRQKMKSNDR